ncbi:hypothetical protein AKJ37_04465 [candidate division MSBL1 archaeon SCGC-AAA259I09]|uniref:Uncharacterized protein n=3 Tax=candidate division MSBL1 TaxID=215777 RepID=A0A133URC3_9EURY|nr:hypothetical protein AKJ62_03375 [candidate division MSBL1 archaeon SCGC-AAA259D14]KXA95468.1 hypothetical protein AKJ36_00445 [candidate division MSBL1 archaeon SCGC-AAA259I07]KXA96775.1 hypothetical protein AKJ37_04465 [candidate division MSBL1 archaeon SCGC-AAA259I09]
MGINLANDNMRVAVDFVSLQSYNVYGLVAIGVKRFEPESEWYYQDPIIGGNTAQIFTCHWLEGLAEAPEGFLAPDTWYRVAIWYTGGYDEVTANSSGAGNEIQVSVDEDIIVQRKEKES